MLRPTDRGRPAWSSTGVNVPANYRVGSGSPVRANESAMVSPRNDGGARPSSASRRRPVQVDGLGVALEVGVVGREHHHLRQGVEHVERVVVAEPRQRGDPKRSAQHVAARCRPTARHRGSGTTAPAVRAPARTTGTSRRASPRPARRARGGGRTRRRRASRRSGSGRRSSVACWPGAPARPDRRRRSWSHPTSAHWPNPAPVLPTWMTAIIPEATAADQSGSQSGCPGDRPPAGSTALGPQEERPRAAFAGPFQLRHGRLPGGPVEDGDGVEAAVAVGQLLGQEVVAAADPGRPFADELQHLPVAAGVHQAVVDPDSVHPRDPLGEDRMVLRVQDHRPAALLGRGDQRRQQIRRTRPRRLRESGQQVAGDGERQQIDALRAGRRATVPAGDRREPGAGSPSASRRR